MESFNPTRLDLARRRRGFSKGKLAESAGITTKTLALYTGGERDPSDEMLMAFAGALDFPVTFFAGADIEEPSSAGVSFRSLKSMTATQEKQAIGAATIAQQLDDWIQSRFNLPELDVPRFEHGSPSDRAEAVRSAWGLGTQPIKHLIHLLEAHGVRVYSLVQECAQVDAFSYWRRDRAYVFLNRQKTAEHSRMDAAHELGHLVMHRHGGPGGREAEEEAKAFAAAFLMPRRDVLAHAPRGATVRQVIAAKHRWNVSAMALTYTLRRLGLITEWQERTLYVQLSKMGYRSGEPDGGDHEKSQILPKVFAALSEDGTSMRDIARELDISTDEIRKATFGLSVAKSGQLPRPQVAARGTPELTIVR